MEEALESAKQFVFDNWKLFWGNQPQYDAKITALEEKLAAAFVIAMRAELEIDCAVACRTCRKSDKPTLQDGRYVHRLAPHYNTEECGANALRLAWDVIHRGDAQ